MNYTLDNLGPHGLPLIGRADWNDCMNLNIFSDEPGESFQVAPLKKDGTVAESVFIAGLFCPRGEGNGRYWRERSRTGICVQHPASRYLAEADEDGGHHLGTRLGWRVVPAGLRCVRREDRVTVV